MIKYISGDILQSKDEYIAQGVAIGSQEGLGTGLAFKLSSKFPEIQKLFKKYTRNTMSYTDIGRHINKLINVS